MKIIGIYLKISKGHTLKVAMVSNKIINRINLRDLKIKKRVNLLHSFLRMLVKASRIKFNNHHRLVLARSSNLRLPLLNYINQIQWYSPIQWLIAVVKRIMSLVQYMIGFKI